jgi:hypothetical protein
MITYTIFMQVKLLYDPSVQMTSCFPTWQPSACSTNFSTAGMQTQIFYIFSEIPNHVQAHANVFIFSEEHSMENSKTELQTSANITLSQEKLFGVILCV